MTDIKPVRADIPKINGHLGAKPNFGPQPTAILLEDPRLRKIFKHYGGHLQRFQLIEECGELTRATSRMMMHTETRIGSDRPEDELNQEAVDDYMAWTGEIADVLIMIEQMMLDPGIRSVVLTQREYKLKRTIRRINGLPDEDQEG
ncbi:hypothetical protein [Sutterella sp.]|uniref:hypothetical protein n=1 Tax=Sutterella sp. TaxID=1981025 RepID=UPI0026DF4398|nr:hypothetical protein [Sutterella sp.]MDO5531050.1 hypothetical protein [Sutterella sp.]